MCCLLFVCLLEKIQAYFQSCSNLFDVGLVIFSLGFLVFFLGGSASLNEMEDLALALVLAGRYFAQLLQLTALLKKYFKHRSLF